MFLARTSGAPSNGRRLLALFLLLLALAGLLAWVIQRNHPVPLPVLHTAPGEKVRCISYAPYHRAGQTPFDKQFVAPAAQIRQDLTRIATLSQCVRIYSVSQGLDQVPEIAKEVGLQVLLGAWIGRESKDNERELATAIRLTRAYPGVIRALIVGNEVLLRREQTEDAMRAYIRRAEEAVDVPVTYADVWEFWLKHDSLAADVDFVTVHILPFWEDQPVAIEDAARHVAEIRERIGRHFAGKPVLIGETGWPSLGRQREGSVPSLVNEATYMREFINLAKQKGWDYNLIEAIDQPWKRKLEGTVGGYWGFLTADRLEPKFPLEAGSAELAESRDMESVLTASVTGLVLCLLLGLSARKGLIPMLSAGAYGALAGACAGLQWFHMQAAYRNPEEWAVLGTVTLLSLASPLLLALAPLGLPLPAADESWRALRRGLVRLLPLAGLLRGLLLFAGGVAALLLWVDPRYRDFPVWLYLPAAIGFGILPHLAGSGWRPVGRAEFLTGSLIALATLGRWVVEPANPQAVLWLVTGLGLASAAWGEPTLRAHQHQ